MIYIPPPLSSIISDFSKLSSSSGQVTNVLLSRLPCVHICRNKAMPCSYKCARIQLACLRHAASVHPEPGSNSLKVFYKVYYPCVFLLGFSQATYFCTSTKNISKEYMKIIEISLLVVYSPQHKAVASKNWRLLAPNIYLIVKKQINQKTDLTICFVCK